MYDIVIGRLEADRQKFGSDGTIFLGKHYVKMGHTTSLSNKVFMDMNRSHVVFIVGKRGGGKCLSGDTLITLDNGLEVPICKLVEDENGIFSLNHNLKITPHKKEGFYKREVDEILCIKLRSGKTIKLTPEHPLLTIKGWLPAEQLGTGSRVATPRKIEAFGSNSLPEHEIKILAYLIAEGHLKKAMTFTNLDPKIVIDLERSLKDFDPGVKLRSLRRGSYKISSYKARKVLGYSLQRDSLGRLSKGSSITHEKTSIRQFLEKHSLYGKLSVEKRLPNAIFQLPKTQLSLFLNRLFSCDGTIYRDGNRWRVGYSSSSKALIEQVHSLLLRFGILSKIRTKWQCLNDKFFEVYELVCEGENVTKYAQEIGFFGKKTERQELALKEVKKTNPNVDTIPKELWDIYRPKNWAAVGKELGYKTPKALRSSIAYSVSRQKLLQIAVAENEDRLRYLAESDIFWDEIVSIELIREKTTVYDITVPELHNFIANDIIVHNSYTMGVIAEGMADLPAEIKNNISIILLDTMGIYWTMRYPNHKDKDLLEQWNLPLKPLDVVIYTPVGYHKQYKEKGIPTDKPFAIKPSELDARDWRLAFEMDENNPVNVLIERVIHDLKKKGADYDLPDIVAEINKDTEFDVATRAAAKNRFINAEGWGVFDKNGTPITELAKGGQVTVLDVSAYATMPGSWNIKSLVVGVVAQKLFIQRMSSRLEEEFKDINAKISFVGDEEVEKQSFPLVWLVVDEAHEFLPKEGKTAATDALITILREGRQPGISLVLASQQPGKIHTDVMTQSDILISHRITAKIDSDALGALMQSYLREGLDKLLDDLPREKGAALVLDDSNEKVFPIRIRPRFTWHGGDTPTAIKKKEKLF